MSDFLAGKFKARAASTDRRNRTRRIKAQTDSMLIIVIPIGWLAIVAFFVILCQMAARGDAVPAATATVYHPSGRAPRRGLRVWDDGVELRPAGAVHLATRSRARVSSGGGVRARRPRCITGS
jgi:hypothetical protein